MIKTRFLQKQPLGRRLLCGLLAACILFAQPSSAASEDASSDPAVTSPTPTPDPHTEAYYQPAETNSIAGWPQGPSVEAVSAVVMDLSTEAILYSKNADQKLYPASITKILTTLLGCEKLSMKEKVQVSQAAAYGIEPGSSTIYADTDEIFTVQQSLMAVMLESANEMALAIGEKVSGSVKKFVELMNQRAAQLGCTNTHFNNPNGLPDETHLTTARDMALIAKGAWGNPLFRRFATRDLFEIPPTNIFQETRYLLNHHKMMEGRDYAYPGVLGGKTGYTVAAGNTLVTYARRKGMSVVVVVMGSIGGGYSDTAALLDYAFGNFQQTGLNVDLEPTLRVQLPCERYLLKNGGNTYPFYYTADAQVTLPAGVDVSALEKRQTLLSNAAGPLRLKSSYYLNGQPVGFGIQYERKVLPDLLVNHG
ncbi:MAG: D-alanyl-D-alanine carboxypeptidase family protein [Eubacteriales bacterium]|nr:D-alanyl-D-alanine carboxypeptidase family protein [Eubacteriales bacterium]